MVNALEEATGMSCACCAGGNATRAPFALSVVAYCSARHHILHARTAHCTPLHAAQARRRHPVGSRPLFCRVHLVRRLHAPCCTRPQRATEHRAFSAAWTPRTTHAPAHARACLAGRAEVRHAHQYQRVRRKSSCATRARVAPRLLPLRARALFAFFTHLAQAHHLWHIPLYAYAALESAARFGISVWRWLVKSGERRQHIHLALISERRKPHLPQRMAMLM